MTLHIGRAEGDTTTGCTHAKWCCFGFKPIWKHVVTFHSLVTLLDLDVAVASATSRHSHRTSSKPHHTFFMVESIKQQASGHNVSFVCQFQSLCATKPFSFPVIRPFFCFIYPQLELGYTIFVYSSLLSSSANSDMMSCTQMSFSSCDVSTRKTVNFLSHGFVASCTASSWATSGFFSTWFLKTMEASSDHCLGFTPVDRIPHYISIFHKVSFK